MSQNSLFIDDIKYVEGVPCIYKGMTELNQHRFVIIDKPNVSKYFTVLPSNIRECKVKKLNALDANLAADCYVFFETRSGLRAGLIKAINPDNTAEIHGVKAKLPLAKAFIYETKLAKKAMQGRHSLRWIMQGKGRKADKCNFGTAAVQDLAL